MNYETATDFELNKRLAGLKGYEVQDKDEFMLKMEIEKIAPEMTKVTCRNKYNPYVQFDYCNDWSDIMPIALDLKVNIQHLDNENIYINVPNVTGLSFPLIGDLSLPPQRALVICCIKVLEARQ